MGGMWFNPETLVDSLSETAGYKAGLALSLDAMCDHLADTDYADLLRESELHMVRIRSEDYEDLFYKLLHRIGYTDEEYDGDHTGVRLFHKYRGTDNEKIHERVLELFLEYWPKLMEETRNSGSKSIDPTPFVKACAQELGRVGLDMAMERLELINKGLNLNPHSGLRYTEWRNVEQLDSLFSGGGDEPEYGRFIDQRFINYLSANPDKLGDMH
jgi:restriction system protein